MSSIEKINPYITNPKVPARTNIDQVPRDLEFDKIFQSITKDPMKGIVKNEEVKGNYTYVKPMMDIEEEIINESLEELLAQGVSEEDVLPIFREVEQRRRQREEDQRNRDDVFDLRLRRYEVTPFQMFIDKSVEVLENISQLEYRVNDLTEQFIRGEVSVDEVSIEVTKLNLAMSFITTVISTASQTFKEITQMQI